MTLTEACKVANRPFNLYSPIKLAKPSDAEDLWVHLRGIDEGFGNGRPTDDALDNIVKLSVRGDHAVAGIARENGRIVASIGLSINQLWYSDEFLLADIWHYVAPTHRRTPYAKTLLRFAKTYADKTSLPLVMTVTTDPQMAPKIRLYSREFEEYGGAFVIPPEKGLPFPPNVYVATKEMWEKVEPLCKWIGGDNALTEVNYSKALHLVREALDLKPEQGTFVAVSMDGPEVRGMIALQIVRNNETGAWGLEEKFIAVPPGEHTANVSLDLMSFARVLAGNLGLDLWIGVASSKRPKTKLRLYRRRFGEPAKLFFRYRGA